MKVSFCELARQYKDLNASEMRRVCESTFDYYLCDGERVDVPMVQQELESKELDILEYLFHCKGGELAAHFYEFYIPPNAIKRFVERQDTSRSFLGYIIYSHNELPFLRHCIPIQVGDFCSILDQNMALKTDIALACTVCPRDFTNAELDYISNHPTLQKWLLLSFRIREIYRSCASWTPANVQFMEQLASIQETAHAA